MIVVCGNGSVAELEVEVGFQPKFAVPDPTWVSTVTYRSTSRHASRIGIDRSFVLWQGTAPIN